jgi:hypothetical protein
MEPNPAEVHVPGDWTGTVVCQANAAYFQKVTVTIVGVAEPIVFQGTGEGVAMTLPNGETGYQFGTRQARNASCLFEFSPEGQNGRFALASVLAPTYVRTSIGMWIQVQSEDSVDNDYNDSVLAFAPTQGNG